MMFKLPLLLMACGLSLAATIPTQAVRIVILHDNDTHSQLYPFGPNDTLGGLSRRATLIRAMRALHSNSLVVNVGDVFVGSTGFNKFFGYPELKLMESLYDAMAVGNHEFDLGPDVLTGILSGVFAGGAPVQLPLLGANLDLTGKPVLDAFISPSMIKTYDGVKVGIFAVLTNDPIHYSLEVAGLIGNPLTVAASTATALKNAGCEAVICLSHNGYLFDRYQLSAVAGIDVIIGGHSHHLVPAETVNGKILVQAGEAGLYLGELELIIDPTKTPKVSLVKHTLHKVDKSIKKDPVVGHTLNALRSQIVRDPRFGPMLSRRVGRADWPIPKTWESQSNFRDTALGNLVSDAVKVAVEDKGFSLDCVIGANGYIGHGIYKGKITGDDILRSLPYGFDPGSGKGFKIEVVKLYGMQLLAGLEFSVAQVEYTQDICLEVSGMEFTYDSSKAPYARLDPMSVKIGGSPINPYGLYWVALNEQLGTFLASLGMIPVEKKVTGILEYDAVSDYIGDLGHVRYRATGRIRDTR
jgi:5'-nucleotidase / UDP-sugar diphosphatase